MDDISQEIGRRRFGEDMSSEAEQKRRRLIIAAGFTAIFTWGGLAYVELGKWAIKGTLFARVLDGRPYTNDFVSYYNAAVLGRRCLSEKIDIYSIELQNESLNKLIAPVVPESPFFLQYPPFFFALMTPLAFIGLFPAWLLWICAGLALVYCSSTTLAARNFPENHKRLLVVGSILSSYPCWLSTELGQMSLFLYAAIATLFHFLEQQRGMAGGLVSAVSMIKFQYYPVIGLIGLICGKVKFLIGACIILSLLLLLSVGVVGLDNVVNYPAALLKGESGAAVSGVSPHMMQNVRGELFVILGDVPAVKYTAAAAMAGGVLFIAWLWLMPGRRFRESDPHAFRVLSSISLLIMLTTSLHTHSQDYLLIGIVAILLLPWLDDRLKQRQSPSLRFARSLLIWWVPVSWLLFFIMQISVLTRVQPFFFWALALLLPVLREVLLPRKPAD